MLDLSVAYALRDNAGLLDVLESRVVSLRTVKKADLGFFRGFCF